VLTLNLAHGRDDSLNQLLVGKQQTYRNLDDIADLLLQISPDVAAFQEADAPSGWSGNFSHVEYLADKTGWANYVHGQHADGWLYAFGTAILSRHHFSATRLHTFSPSFPTTTKGFVAATVDWQRNDEALALTVISVHLDFSRESVRQAQIEELIDYAATLTGPFVVAGDFNDEWNDDDSSIRELMERLKLKAFQPHAEHLGTYKSTDGKRLDWILLSEGLEFLTYNVVTEEISDHYAVVAEIMPNAR
jgi:endonuclease/exonuclease/phosphatase family metal-dependent hydrolase